MTANPDLVLLLVALPFCIWAFSSDLRYMKIWNVTNLGLFAAFCLVGLFLFPWDVFLLRLAQGAVMLAIGYLLNFIGQMGGGDSKFIGAMAPYIAFEDAFSYLMLQSVIALLTVALHRGLVAIPAINNRFAHWTSFGEKRKFPFGVTLSVTLVAYLLLKSFWI